ncbi:hypothetical protein [Pantoea agglomerans]|uniref:hypothetical protein n=1 Tax=Enterobacter agglomerans TaxID=549 RepID=UPI0039659DDD
MHIPDELIPDINDSSRPVIIYRNKDGSFSEGFVLRSDEVVISLRMLKSAMNCAGMPVIDAGDLPPYNNEQV